MSLFFIHSSDNVTVVSLTLVLALRLKLENKLQPGCFPSAGESEQRIYLLSAWREAPFYSERERAALEWTESLTLIADNHVPDDIYERVKLHFTDAELVNLTLAVTTINAWNRLAISFRSEPGHYQPKKEAMAH
jgi:hypothetical protein